MKGRTRAQEFAAGRSTGKALLRLQTRWERSAHTLDYLLAQEFQGGNSGAQEKAQITDAAANWARGRGAARYLLNQKLLKPLDSLPPPLRRRLELAVCELLFEERTPQAVLVYQAVEEIKAAFGVKLAGMANAVLREIAGEPPEWPDAQTDPVAHLSAAFSHPSWMVERWLQRWGLQRTREQLAWDNQRPALWLRTNRLRGNSQWARERLRAAQVEVEVDPAFEGYFKLLSPYMPAAAELVEAGDFSVQDPSASLAVRLLDPQPGMKILDLCAAPGGKTTLIAELTGDQAQIIAVDPSADRMKRLGESLGRLGINSVQAAIRDGRKFHPARPGMGLFDAVLLDVPCSGFGVLARRADLRWRRAPGDLPRLVALQKDLMRAGSRCVGPGGALVYSTCSIEPEENEDIVNDFLRQFDNFTLDDCRLRIPDGFIVGRGQVATYSPRDRVDGIYAARLIRKN